LRRDEDGGEHRAILRGRLDGDVLPDDPAVDSDEGAGRGRALRAERGQADRVLRIAEPRDRARDAERRRRGVVVEGRFEDAVDVDGRLALVGTADRVPGDGGSAEAEERRLLSQIRARVAPAGGAARSDRLPDV